MKWLIYLYKNKTNELKIKIMSKEDLIEAIVSRLDTIEELVDNLEENKVNVESFRDSLGKVWDEIDKLSE